jgi:hypothetical protein
MPIQSKILNIYINEEIVIQIFLLLISDYGKEKTGVIVSHWTFLTPSDSSDSKDSIMMRSSLPPPRNHRFSLWLRYIFSTTLSKN